ncbi:PorP/SprF family type IX secretion system membrane protein [Flagellimonas sp.]|jgi:type IX secretion system PorP/SprF family membrane protein|uniref:PorP/SprF family type IX secretion system membrane protein n=1 Tax=Flagellimonas sp. TaxID=2058762 RepID=UPI000B6EDA15|nr:MAG: type IX secretion system membrane protein PorP/SprF [Muricauda sp. TMED12]|tara:strand:- start:4046 stop:5836 length:1791 start_codon:yes stop_codon:yes gene_type:complete
MEIKLPPFPQFIFPSQFERYLFALLIVLFLGLPLQAQEENNPYVSYDVPFQNLLKFNRFLINPTFSSIREDKSYINFFHRSQSADFNNNRQNYFLSYSGRLNDRVGLGLSLYNQSAGVISNLGVMANYSHGIQLGEESSLTFGVNIPYYVSSYDPSRAVAVEGSDPTLSEIEESSVISFQPGLNLSLGKFDFGVFAQNLVDYNLKTGKSLTNLNQKTFSGHIQFAHEFENGRGIFEDGRLMPLARARFEGNEDPVFGGGIILDLPKLGWIQGGYDQFYGASAGTGFNLNQRLSFGYNFEKSLSNSIANLGVTHEISIAYSFVPNLSKNTFVSNEEEEKKKIENSAVADASDEAGKTKQKSKLDVETTLRPYNKEDRAYWEERITQLQEQQEDSYAVIDDLLYKMDSMKQSREQEMEKRFEMVMRIVKRHNGNKIPDIEKNAQKLYLADNKDLDSVYNAIEASTTAALAQNTKPVSKQTETKSEGPFNGGDFKPIEKFINLEGVGQGHYIVANVFKNEIYLKNFMQELKSQGLDAQYFKNPDNGLNYVYLAKYEENDRAYAAYKSRMKGKYQDEIWIMHVENPRYSNWADAIFQDIE